MEELELKFAVPEFRVEAVRKDATIKSSHTEQLEAYYFDTSEQDLAKHQIALRIRKEGQDWVQTIKAAGDGIVARLEDNIVLDIADDTSISDLMPDLSLHEHAEIKTALKQIDKIKKIQKDLKLNYYTSVKRLIRPTRRANCLIEIAFDQGEVGIQPNQAQSQAHKTVLRELELELKDGDIAVLFDTAKQWCKRHKLFLLSPSKAERGYRLNKQIDYAPATKSSVETLDLDQKISQAEFLQAAVHNCLIQILPNVSEIAEGSPDGKHVHQARVGIRRLRTLLSAFESFSTVDFNEIKNVLKHTFSLLGEYRDIEILQTKTQPALESEGAPYVDWKMDIKVIPMDAVRAIDFQLALLDLIKFCMLPIEHIATEDNMPVKPILSVYLDKQFSKITKASKRFADLDTESQHDVRKRLKKLRYISEFAASLYPSDKTDKFLAKLEPAQDILGDYNDAIVGMEAYQQKAESDPKAYFAAGWFQAHQQAYAQECADVLKKINKAPVFW